MNVTEKNAALFWCPRTTMGRSKGDHHHPLQRCIASSCMWWKWDEELYDGPDSYVSEPPPTGHCGGAP